MYRNGLLVLLALFTLSAVYSCGSDSEGISPTGGSSATGGGVSGGNSAIAGQGGTTANSDSSGVGTGGATPVTGGSGTENASAGSGGSPDTSSCGNGHIDIGEQCDCGEDDSCTLQELDGATCASLEKGTGTVKCTTECLLDLSMCSTPSDSDAGAYGNEQTDSAVMDQECDPSDQTPPPTVVNWTAGIGAPPTGPYQVTIEHDPGLDTHTVYRPVLGDIKHPIVAWANGGCMRDGLMFDEFLVEIASHGFLIISNGPPNGTGMEPGGLTTNGVPQIQAIDWAVQENERPCSQYYHKLNTDKVAVMGQSCGGLMTFGASGDPRVTTVVIWNSGMFERDQAIYDGLHTHLAFFIGGASDVAFTQAEADFAAINRPDIPIFYGNLNVGHMGTYGQDNGGEFARVGVAWLKWQLFDEQGPNGKEMFVGANCGLCNTDWVIQKKNME